MGPRRKAPNKLTFRVAVTKTDSLPGQTMTANFVSGGMQSNL